MTLRTTRAITLPLSEQITIRRLRRPQGIEVKRIRNASSLWRVFHQHYDLFLQVTGSSERLFHGRRIAREPGEMMIYRPDDFDANTHIDPGSQLLVVSIDPALIVHSEAKGCLSHLAPPSPDLATTITRLVSSVLEGDDDFADECLAAELIARLGAGRLAGGGREHGEHKALRTGIEYLSARLANAVSLDELAAETNLNKYYLTRIFKRHFGTSPHAFHLSMRIGRARGLLREGQRPSSVARALGFADQSHFYRVFLKHVGVTPSRYARDYP